tara:strand:+ start:2060 stop:2764 length:705 start_codon:yes stop_codon:yes gene_type:complete
VFILGSENGKIDSLQSPITFAGTNFNLVKNGDSYFHYIWLHGDEKTAKIALDYHISHFPGKAFFIQNDNREIPYLSTIIDPNRLFSRSGSYNSLIKFKPYWPPGTLKNALDDLDRDRIQFLRIIMPKNDGVLISVHNNFRGYNVKYELKYSRKTSIKKQQNPRDFILCTHEKDFEKLANGPYNVVLQDTAIKRDDGSLSWESLRRNVRYVNIETRLGYLAKQKKMLAFVHNTLY